MNKVELMGRLVRAPETRYANDNTPVCIYTIAVNRRFKNKQGNYDADFINCKAWGKAGEFVENYFKKGQLVTVVGSIRVSSWDDNGAKRWRFEVITEEHYFAEGKKETKTGDNEGFYPIDERLEDDDLPF